MQFLMWKLIVPNKNIINFVTYFAYTFPMHKFYIILYIIISMYSLLKFGQWNFPEI